jgi:hypothetical protein
MADVSTFFQVGGQKKLRERKAIQLLVKPTRSYSRLKITLNIQSVNLFILGLRLVLCTVSKSYLVALYIDHLRY